MRKMIGTILAAVLTIALILVLMNFNWPNKTSGYRLGGTLSEEAGQKDIEDLDNLATLYNTEVLIMESFPMQFSATFKNPSDCDGMEKTLAKLNYVASVGNCQAVLTN